MILKTLKDLPWVVTDGDMALAVSIEDLKELVKHWIEQTQEKLKKEKNQEAIWFAKGAINVLKRLHNLEGMR